MEKKKKKQFCVVSGDTISTFYPFFIHNHRKGRKRKEVRGETRGWIGSTFSWSMPEPQLCRYRSDKISKAFGLWCQIWLFILTFDLEILTQDQIDGMEENEQMNQRTLPRTLIVENGDSIQGLFNASVGQFLITYLCSIYGYFRGRVQASCCGVSQSKRFTFLQTHAVSGTATADTFLIILKKNHILTLFFLT